MIDIISVVKIIKFNTDYCHMDITMNMTRSSEKLKMNYTRHRFLVMIARWTYCRTLEGSAYI